jgi:predicted negative regulator of RcsB-dependent stress response
MDSQTRHELEENDLARAISHFKDFWTKHGTRVLLIVLVTSALVLGFRFVRNSMRQARDAELTALAMATDPAAFQRVAQDADDETVAALANLRGADLLLGQLMKPAEEGKAGLTSDQRQQFLADAEKMCRKVVTQNHHKLLVINATFRLATIAENKGEWEQAKQHYQTIQKLAGEDYPHFRKRAEGFEAALDRAAKPPVFAKEEPKKPDLPPLLVNPDNLTPQDKKPQDKEPQDKNPQEKTSEDKTPGSQKPEDPAKPAEAKPAEAKPADAKPTEAKPAETKPEEKKPAPQP